MSDAFAPFERLAVLGLGLLGGSVALAARRAGAARSIAAAGRRRAPLDAALAAGVVDEIGDAAQAVRGADLVVLGAPVAAMPSLLESAASQLAPGAIVTDVGSVKGPLANLLPGLLPDGVHYVGSHPMAGSHESGVEHARADLFDGAACVVTPLAQSDALACRRVEAFWRAIGARVVTRDPVQHDEEVAWTSHAPHAIAFAFAHALANAPDGASELAGSGFRDFTRIARSGAELWGDILSANAKALSGPLQAFGDSLGELARAIEAGDAEALERFLSSARDALAATLPEGVRAEDDNARSGGENPEIQAAPSAGGHPRRTTKPE